MKSREGPSRSGKRGVHMSGVDTGRSCSLGDKVPAYILYYVCSTPSTSFLSPKAAAPPPTQKPLFLCSQPDSDARPQLCCGSTCSSTEYANGAAKSSANLEKCPRLSLSMKVSELRLLSQRSCFTYSCSPRIGQDRYLGGHLLFAQDYQDPYVHSCA